LWRRRHCCCCRVFAVEIIDESPGNIESISGINKWHLAAVDYDVDVMTLRICFQSLADVILKWRKYLFAPAIISSLGVFALALEILLHLLQLILFGLERFWICNGRRLGDIVGERLNFLLQVLQFGLTRLKFAIQCAHESIETRDAGFGIEESVGDLMDTSPESKYQPENTSNRVATAVPVTAIIPAHNEADIIADTVRATLSIPSVSEVIVVDDASTDGTAEIAEKAGYKTHSAVLKRINRIAEQYLDYIDENENLKSLSD
jgi:hypothetical protein